MTLPIDEGAIAEAKSHRGQGWRGTLDLAATLGTIVASVWIIIILAEGHFSPAAGRASAARPTPTVPHGSLSRDGAARQGRLTAKVALIEYSDFQCPFCGKFAREILPSLVKKYVDSGDVLLIFRNFPLPIHPLARPAAEAAVCADQQGKFWEAHEAFFDDQNHLGDLIRALPSDVGLAAGPFDGCVGGPAKGRGGRDLADGTGAKVVGTPEFLIGEIQSDRRMKPLRVLAGARPLSEFEEALDNVL